VMALRATEAARGLLHTWCAWTCGSAAAAAPRQRIHVRGTDTAAAAAAAVCLTRRQVSLPRPRRHVGGAGCRRDLHTGEPPPPEKRDDLLRQLREAQVGGRPVACRVVCVCVCVCVCVLLCKKRGGSECALLL